MGPITNDPSPFLSQLRQLFSPAQPTANGPSATSTPKLTTPNTQSDDSVYKFLHDRIRDRLSSRYALPVPISPAYAAWDDKHHVADRLNALAHRVLAEVTPQQSPDAWADVQNALAQGMAETRAAAAPTTTQDEALNDIYRQVQNALGAYSSQGLAYHDAQQTRIKLVTREGDVVTIDMSRKIDMSYGHAESDGGNATVFTYASETTLRYRVKGDLNDNELTAIGDLLGRLDGLADGDLSSATLNDIAGGDAFDKIAVQTGGQRDFAGIVQGHGADKVSVQDMFSQLFDNLQNLQALFDNILSIKQPGNNTTV